MKDSYDIVVVGGGPGGSYTAKVAAEGGADVLLIEKDREIGIPVRCAEGVGEAGLREFFEPDPAWVANKIEGFTFIAPDETYVDMEVERSGYVLERKIFDRMIAELAAKAGAKLVTRVAATGLLVEDGRVSGVEVSHSGGTQAIRSKIVVGADGVESRVGRWAGLRTFCKLHDIQTCVQYTLAGIEIDLSRCQLWFGSKVAPGGYLWVFPKGEGIANVGLGISGDFSRYRSPLEYLDSFVERYFPKSSIMMSTSGAVPCSGGIKNIVGNGVMLVGDAAHQVNPLTGGGIINAMKAGRIAGRLALDALADNDVSAERLKVYQDEWNELLGKNHKRYYRIKEAVFHISDETFNHIASEFGKLPQTKRTLFRLFTIALFNKPSLLAELPRLFFY